MRPKTTSEPAFRHLSARLSVSGEPVQLELEVPAGPVHPVRLLPSLQAAANAFVDAAEKAVQRAGLSVSCQKGCGACCRQLVPIAPSEARALALLVEELPDERRKRVLSRFQDAGTALEGAGLRRTLLPGPDLTKETSREVGLSYFHLRIACPFLEDESCSIHPDRPLACREYLVTSPSGLCADPAPERIETVPMPVKLSTGLQRVSRSWEGQAWLPLVLALEWVEEHPEEPALPDGGAEFENIVKSTLAAAGKTRSAS
ncbi:MAG: YkgJ family cysteine cluster protein [Acidobacteria bacterium]|nr:YkgJ family cysteine cluster protein [Acidobacteriota bacterium]MCG3194409.1 hypothetical protein [Thermoanaerobaculia bacterium]